MKREAGEFDEDDEFDDHGAFNSVGGGGGRRSGRRSSKWSEARGREAKYVPRPPPSERTLELFRRIRACEGTIAVEMGREPLTEQDGRMEKRKETELMAAFGLKRVDAGEELGVIYYYKDRDKVPSLQLVD